MSRDKGALAAVATVAGGSAILGIGCLGLVLLVLLMMALALAPALLGGWLMMALWNEVVAPASGLAPIGFWAAWGISWVLLVVFGTIRGARKRGAA